MLSMSTGQQIPTDWREGRRLRAWELKQQGWSQQSIADALGVSPGAVSQWMRRAREGGVEGLKRRVAPGPTPKLTDEQRAKLPLLLAQGAEAFGFRGDVWTAKRVTTVIRREFGVRYHPNHIGNLLRAAGWSVQKPVQRASQRNEAADRGVAGRALAGPKKGADQEGRTIVWVDESGFYLLPGAIRTYAPRGQTPILRLPLSRDHLAVISGITPAGRLLLLVQEHPYKSPDIVRFLKHLLRHIPGKLLVIWDGAPIHRGQPVKDFLTQGGTRRIQLEQLPGYAPDLNPDEGIWRALKHAELRNRCCQDLGELRWELGLAIRRLRRKRQVIQGCFQQCGFSV